MSLLGKRIGPYNILDLIGEGGMGQVYRANDTRLSRDVALKVLPEQFSADSDRLARFQREAQALASLNHPNIATIHGLEQSGSMRALVMELVEGPTLAERIAQGPMAVEEVLPIAKQIAEALEYAHDRGIIHRDLKPANIKITPTGQVKILDFGLAKAMGGETPASNVSNSPTISLAATQAGIILGTAAYMSPEQAKGKPVDRRTDIWAFGVVVYEMLTGRRLFSAEDVTETIAQVVMKDPDWTALPANTPARLGDVLRRCLVRDPRSRIQAIGDVRIAIEEAMAHPERESAVAQVQPSSGPLKAWHRAVPWVVALASLIAAGLTLVAPWRTTPEPAIRRLSTGLGVDASLDTNMGAAAVLSPNGETLAFVARQSSTGRPLLYVRQLDQLNASALAGTEGARNHFFSPDGQWIGFFAGGKLKKISATGGAAVTLCDTPDDRGGTWGDDGSIIFTPAGSPGVSLMRIPSQGGTPERFTKVVENEVTHRWPQVLPEGRAVIFTANNVAANYDTANIVVQSLSSGERKIVQRGGYHARYLPSGHLVYVYQGTLFAAPFDVDRLEMTSPPVPVIEGVASLSNFGAAQFSFSEDGSLVYLPGANVAPGVSIFWMDRNGKTQPLRATADYFNIRFSPDGRRVAMDVLDQQYDIWIYEWARDTMSRLTFDPSSDRNPVWTPDGHRITFRSQRGDKSVDNFYWQRADGTGQPQRLTESKNGQIPESWHPSGKFLAFRENRPQTNWDIMILPMGGDETSGWKPGKPAVFLESPFFESEAAFSPDGRWLAYASDESGRNEVYVRPFPGPGGKWQISTEGGGFPTWSRNGKELFYRTPDQRIWVATYSADNDSFRADRSRQWSEGTFTNRGLRARNFDLHPDGLRFAVLKTPESQTETKLDKVVLIFNFFEALRRLTRGPTSAPAR